MHFFSRSPSDSENKPLEPQALGGVLANSGVLAITVLRQGNIVFANPAFLGMFCPGGNLTDVPLVELVEDSGSDRLEVALAAAERGPTHYSGTGRRGDDVPFDVELTLERAVLDGEPVV